GQAEDHFQKEEYQAALECLNYAMTDKALEATRFNQAAPLDKDQQVAGARTKAEEHFKKEEYAAARECLEAAGEMATALIAQSGMYVQSPKQGGQIVPSKADQVGAPRKLKSKELSPGVRDKDISTGVYYANTPEKRAQSEFKVGPDGRLIDAQGNALNSSHGYAVNAQDGTRHHFDSSGTSRK